MISGKSVFSHRKCRLMALHTKPSVQISDTKIDVRNRILAGNFGGKAPSRPEAVRMLEPDKDCQARRIRLARDPQIVSSFQLENKQLATASAGSEKTSAELTLRCPALLLFGGQFRAISYRLQRGSQRVDLMLTRCASFEVAHLRPSQPAA